MLLKAVQCFSWDSQNYGFCDPCLLNANCVFLLFFQCDLLRLPLIFSAYLGLMGGLFSIKVPETQEGAETPEGKCDPLALKKVCCLFL